MWLAFILDFLKAIPVFKTIWGWFQPTPEKDEAKAHETENDVNALSDADVLDKLHQWRK